MLQLILGRSGSGKTQWVRDRLAALAAESSIPLFLLVPEQFSFESERSLLQTLGPARAGRVQVLSFTRLAETVFRELGDTAEPRLDEATRALLMSRALEEAADRLTLYARHTTDPDTILSMLAVLSECRQCAVSSRQLEEAAARLPTGTLKRKAADLALILDAYEALAAHVYRDPLDDLSLLAKRIPESHVAEGAHLYVDGFKGFTAQEMQVLGVLMRRTASLTVTLCTDTLDDPNGGFGRFSGVIRTASRLHELAYANHIPVQKPHRLTVNHRTQSDALRTLEEGCFTPCPAVCDADAPDVTVAACADIYAECAWVARTIRQQLRTQGGRCRDIAIVMRRPEDYRGLLDTALEKEGISYFMDNRTDILTEPLITLLLSALHGAVDGWDTETLLRLMKTGLAGFSAHSTALLENYVYTWRITGARWKQPFTENPSGLTAMTEEDARQLETVERLRRRLMKPLEALQGALSPAKRLTGDAFVRALLAYLRANRTARLVRLQVARLDAAKEPALAQRAARIWDVLMTLFDRFAEALGTTTLPASRCAELLRMMLQLTDLGSIPQGLDAVQIGGADRMRFNNPHTVYVLGAVEGVFPAYPTPQGLLSDDDRRKLAALGLTMADPSDQQTVEERFFAYAALSAPSERLYVSYAVGNAAGETLSPSSLVETVRNILPHSRFLTIPDETDLALESEADAFDRLAAVWDKPTTLSATLRQIFAARPAYQARLQAMDRAYRHAPASFTQEETARRFFGNDMRLSPSQTERYHQCRFAYFCEYGLRARARRPADLDAAAFGTVTHWVMEHLLSGYAARGFGTIRREEVFSDASRAIEEYAATALGGIEAKSSRFVHLLTRLERLCGSLLWQVVQELRQSRFVPVDYELSIGQPSEEGQGFVEPLTLTLPDGTRVRMQGKVDRVDVFHRDGVAYIRVIDYKTGARQFRLSEAIEGINLQMLIYVLSIWANGEARYGKVLPAGVLYLPAKLPVVKIDRNDGEDVIAQERIAAMRMNGLLLDDPEILKAMETDIAGIFIPARLTSKGNYDSRITSVASLEQFGLLKRRMERLLTDMANTLRRGDIAAQPLIGKQNDACAWCDYRAVCGREDDDPVRTIADRDASEVLRELEKEDGGEVPAPSGEVEQHA